MTDPQQEQQDQTKSKPKTPAEQLADLRKEQDTLERQLLGGIRTIRENTEGVCREVIRKSLAECKKTSDVKSAALALAKRDLEQAKKAADRAHDEEVRTAQGVRQRRVNEATKKFEQARDALEADAAEKNRPVREAAEVKVAELRDQAKKAEEKLRQLHADQAKALWNHLAELQPPAAVEAAPTGSA